MRYKITIGTVICLIIIAVISGQAAGSWVKLTPQQLDQDADVILVGHIEGPVGVTKSDSTGLDTKWKVLVYYYLKGDIRDKYFAVYTPGAEASSIKTSIDYKLDEWGRTVLLFLQKHDESYYPLTPQGVLSLEGSRGRLKKEATPTGKTILEEFSINDTKITSQEKAEFEDIIRGKGVFKPSDNNLQTTENQSSRITVNSLAVLVLILGGVVTLLIMKRKRL